MSLIGKKIIQLPAGVTTQVANDVVSVKGPKGELKVTLLPGITFNQEEGGIRIGRTNDERQTRAYHGLIRSLVNNAVIGVTDGYQKTLKLIGTGYRVAMKGAGLSLSLGFSHPVEFAAVQGITFKIDGNDTIMISGFDKHLVGQVAANIRKIRPPEPYKGKGVRYEDEVVRRKAGKTATK